MARLDAAETYVGCSLDTLLESPLSATFHYRVSIPETERFVAAGGTPYWLTIAAVNGSVSCACDSDIASPLGSYDMADVQAVSSQVGCAVGIGDPACDQADVNCDGGVDEADVTMADCQRLSGWADPACCYVISEHLWSWTVRPQVSPNGAVLIQSPTLPETGNDFGGGAPVTDAESQPWDASFVFISVPADVVAPQPPDADPSGVGKNRYIGFAVPPSWSGNDIAIRVRLASLDRFPAFDGQFRWADAGAFYPDDASGNTLFYASMLGCTPVFTTWPAGEIVHLYGVEVVPQSTYEIQAVDASCAGDLNNEACYSAPLVVETNKWGDVVAPLGGAPQPNFGDVNAIVVKFQGFAGAVAKTMAQLQPNLPNPAIFVNFADINAGVGAFQGIPYSFAGPTACP